jgi:hypothetical protein
MVNENQTLHSYAWAPLNGPWLITRPDSKKLLDMYVPYKQEGTE